MKCALWPFREGHIFARGRFDFYGPFWIMVTLNVCVTICGNMVHYIKWAQSEADEDFEVGVSKIGTSAFIIYLYLFANPLVLYALFKSAGA